MIFMPWVRKECEKPTAHKPCRGYPLEDYTQRACHVRKNSKDLMMALSMRIFVLYFLRLKLS